MLEFLFEFWLWSDLEGTETFPQRNYVGQQNFSCSPSTSPTDSLSPSPAPFPQSMGVPWFSVWREFGNQPSDYVPTSKGRHWNCERKLAPMELLCSLFVCFFDLGSATYCIYDSDCSYRRSYCTDSVVHAVCTTADVNRTNNAVIAYVSVVSLLVPVRSLPVWIGQEML